MDGSLGLPFQFIDPDMVVITVTATLLKVNDSYSAANVAMIAPGSESDTADSAQAVQNVCGIDQNDCTMHVVSLLLSYLIGMRENYKTKKTVLIQSYSWRNISFWFWDYQGPQRYDQLIWQFPAMQGRSWNNKKGCNVSIAKISRVQVKLEYRPILHC